MDLELSPPVYCIPKGEDGYRMVVDWILNEDLTRDPR